MRYLLVLSFIFNYLCAHPHTFIEIYANIEVEKQKTKKLNFTWKMDEMTSSMLIMETDQNGDGKLDKEESKFIYDNYFLSLKEYNYYTDIKIKNKTQSFPKVSNFKAFIENNKLCYSFDMDKNFDISNTIFDFGDEDFFVAFVVKPEFINIKGAKASVQEMDNDFYFGYRLSLK